MGRRTLRPSNGFSVTAILPYPSPFCNICSIDICVPERGSRGKPPVCTVAALRFPALFGPPIAPLLLTVGPNRPEALYAPSSRGPSSKSARLFCHWQRFADFLESGSLHPPLAALHRFPLDLPYHRVERNCALFVSACGETEQRSVSFSFPHKSRAFAGTPLRHW